jgi:hypothetical protein
MGFSQSLVGDRIICSLGENFKLISAFDIIMKRYLTLEVDPEMYPKRGELQMQINSPVKT